MAKRKEHLCPVCHALLDKYNRTRQEVNGVIVFLCMGCAEAAQKGREAFKQRIKDADTARLIRKIIRKQDKKKKEDPPDPFEQQLNGMLEDMRKAEEFFKQIR